MPHLLHEELTGVVRQSAFKATGIRVGLLVNFGAPRLQVRRCVFGSSDSVPSVSSVAAPSLRALAST